MQKAAKYWHKLESTLSFFKLYELKDSDTDSKMRAFCGTFASLCSAINSFLNIGPSPWNDPAICAVDDARPSSSASLKQVVHYGQIFDTGVFKQYDWGNDKENTEHYGNNIVPLLSLYTIDKVPIAYFVGLHDDLGDPTDTAYTYKQIKTAFTYKLYNDMDHYSFQVGRDMRYVDDVLELLGQYNTEEPVELPPKKEMKLEDLMLY